MIHGTRLHVVFSVVLFLSNLASASEEESVLQIRESRTLDPQKRYAGLVILASDVTIDGRGAVIEGDLQVLPKDRKGVGVQASNVHRVLLKNVKVKGFRTGIELTDCSQWTVDSCDFSDNASDPEFGWGESHLRGGIYLDKVTDSKWIGCTSQRNWNNCELMRCTGVAVQDCDFSEASNTCLSMRGSDRNRILGNNLSRGIRIAPGEVHARDSTCVLIEGGCHENELRGNDCRFGGDGIFIRAIGGSISTRNLIQGNDCSYAHNNAIECGSPGNRFVGNTANHSSYGMWMGGSDQTEIIDNEVCFNGLRTGHHNSPHLPLEGHAGIVYMFATAEHIVIRGNRCIGNNGAGIVLFSAQNGQGTSRLFPTQITIANNQLVENTWGLSLQDAELTFVHNNLIARNRVTRIENHGSGAVIEINDNADAEYQHKLCRLLSGVIEGAEVLRAGSSATYQLQLPEGVERPTNDSHATWQWIVDGKIVSRDPAFEFAPIVPGPMVLAVRYVHPPVFAYAWKNIAVVDGSDGVELGTNPQAWRADPGENGFAFERDTEHMLAGDSSLRIDIDPYDGVRATCHLELERASDHRIVTDDTHLSFWLDARVTASAGWQNFSPEIAIVDSLGKRAVYRPELEILNRMPDMRNRSGWQQIRFRLRNPVGWTHHGDLPTDIESISLSFDTWEHDPIRIWIDQLTLTGVR